MRCVFDWAAQVHKKTHDRLQPWVLVETLVIVDKIQRRRRLRRRRPAAELVELLSLRVKGIEPAGSRQAENIPTITHR
jgi:hypothetical protein